MSSESDPVIGRDIEIDRLICILCRRTKNCAALVGEAGVGKTAIIESLTQRIASGKVPAMLAGARVMQVDIGAMVAGASLCGMFEARIKDVINRAEDGNGKVILFIDEMHMLLGAGDVVGGRDAANLLKPALARGRIRCVGATTLKEYRKYIEKDAALERRFQKVHVEEPSVQATIAILRGLKQRYIGYEDGGQLTEKVKKRPYSVVLFDEVEKAHPSVFNIFLQLLDDGLLTDGKGRTVDFKNTIIIMTSNLGSKHLAARMAGENIARLSEIVIFEPLSHNKLKEVVKIQMKGVIARVANKGISLRASNAALNVILSESYEPMYGARPIRRWMQKNVMTAISEMLVRGEAGDGSTISIDASGGKKGLKYEVVNKAADPPDNLSVPVLETLGESDEKRADPAMVTSLGETMTSWGLPRRLDQVRRATAIRILDLRQRPSGPQSAARCSPPPSSLELG
ncbi:unnamed protein product [Alopecurus aequalis]